MSAPCEPNCMPLPPGTHAYARVTGTPHNCGCLARHQPAGLQQCWCAPMAARFHSRPKPWVPVGTEHPPVSSGCQGELKRAWGSTIAEAPQRHSPMQLHPTSQPTQQRGPLLTPVPHCSCSHIASLGNLPARSRPDAERSMRHYPVAAPAQHAT
jgi:hypothetical protein